MNKIILKRQFIALATLTLLLFILFTGQKSFADTQLKAEVSQIGSIESKHEPGLFDIDYGILFSQTLNFLILLFVLKKLLFERVAQALENRQKAIGKLRLDAEKNYEEAEKLKKHYQELIDKIEEKAYELRQKAIQDAKQDTLHIVEEAKKKAEQIIEKGEMDLFTERQTAWAQIREQLVDLTAMATEKVLEDSLDDEMHRKIILRSIAKIEKDLPDHRKQ